MLMQHVLKVKSIDPDRRYADELIIEPDDDLTGMPEIRMYIFDLTWVSVIS